MPKLLGETPLTPAERQARYRAANAERVLAARRTPEYVASIAAAGRRRNEKVKARNAAAGRSRTIFETEEERHEANLRRARDHNMTRRAQKTALFVERVRRVQVFVRDGGVCHICLLLVDPTDWDLDHVIPFALGGPHCYANTAVSHPSCNASKRAQDVGGSLEHINRAARDAFWSFHVGAL